MNAAPDVMQFGKDVRNSSAKIAQGLTSFIQQNDDHHIQGSAYTMTPYAKVRWV